MLMVMIAAGFLAQQPLLGPPVEPQFERAREQFDRQMIDYPAARFRDVYGDRRRLCGYVNGKNRMGAYSGWQRFVISGTENSKLIIEPDDQIGEIGLMCDGDDAPPTSPDYSDRLTYR